MKGTVSSAWAMLFGLVLIGGSLFPAQNGVADDKDKPKAKEVEIFEEGDKRGYKPQELTIRVGESVVWINKKGNEDEHTATAKDKEDSKPIFDTGRLKPGKPSMEIEFKKAGTYNYFCKPHPDMKGTIIVK